MAVNTGKYMLLYSSSFFRKKANPAATMDIATRI
jgi:hypothetical protein